LPRLPREQHALSARFKASLAEDLRSAERVVLAVSGGADSMALLELWSLERDVSADVVVYVDHGLRSEAANEAASVRRAAERHGATFRFAALDGTRADEASLRDSRYAVLWRVVEEVGAAFLLTGHTRDDQVETILHRLVRGAGRRGLSGMRERRGALARPLLDLRREELRAFLSALAVEWCEDASNRDNRYLRNRIRNEVIPQLERELGDDCLDHLPDMARLWAEEEAYLESEAARFGSVAELGAATDRRLETAILLAAPRALHTRIAKRWLAARSGRPPESFTRAELERVLELARRSSGECAIDLAGVTVLVCGGELRATPRPLGARERQGECKG
jgi:tRNA(Ile)-lysidine synthase